MLIYVQFGIIHNLQMSPVPQTSFLVRTFFAASYSKTALGCQIIIDFSLQKIIFENAFKESAKLGLVILIQDISYFVITLV